MQYYNDSSYSSHYAQAYAQYSSLSPPMPQGPPHWAPYPVMQHGQHLPPNLLAQLPNYHQMSSWYQPGPSRCTQKGCLFMGSPKSLEVHMMDRHLIYPPNWERRKQRSDWDADPSLKGKPVHIQGTNIMLNTPESLEAWIAERKRRWPSQARVEEQRKKLDEAIARGQIIPTDSKFRERKRRRLLDQSNDNDTKNTPSGSRSIRGEEQKPRTVHPLPKNPSKLSQNAPIGSMPDQSPKLLDSKDRGSDDDDSGPEVVTSRAAEPTVPIASMTAAEPVVRPSLKRPRPAQPSKPLRPMFPHPPLLRNLLLPEIRVTVSNLSQAIRFLVDNSFLEGVELTPGEADQRLIEDLS